MHEGIPAMEDPLDRNCHPGTSRDTPEAQGIQFTGTVTAPWAVTMRSR